MTPYRNLGGGSNVASFECGNDYIRVRFRDGKTYLYSHASAGSANVEHAKTLAIAGRGLNSFINLRMKRSYASKA